MVTIKSYLLPLFGFFAPATKEPSPRISNHPTVNHVQMISELKDYFEKKGQISTKPNLTDKTPTLAYLDAASKVLNVSQLEELHARKKAYPELVKQVIENEKRYCKDYYVFYHSQQLQLSVLQDFLKEFYALISIHNPDVKFAFLRMWHEAKKTTNAEEFLSKLEGGWWGMHKQDMMCVNLSLFGNIKWDGEDSFWYFKNGFNCGAPHIDTLLEQFCKHFGLDTKYVSEISDLTKAINTDEGHLLQIFIPKEKVDEYLYLSVPGCAPYQDKIDDACYDNTKKRHTKISPILDKYISNFSDIANGNNLQARLLLSNDFMLNPASGVKIFKHTTLDNKKMQEYKAKLHELARTIFSQALEKNTLKNLHATKLEKLLELINQ